MVFMIQLKDIFENLTIIIIQQNDIFKNLTSIIKVVFNSLQNTIKGIFKNMFKNFTSIIIVVQNIKSFSNYN